MAVDGPPPELTFAFRTSTESIEGHDGTKLKAIVIAPDGDGPFPLLVMPSSWAVDRLEYIGAAVKLVHDSDYIVVSYTSRGFWNSGGEIDIAGPDTVKDVSAVIDWALANTPADEDRIGAVGISYGAGTSLLAAAHDKRIKSVAAMSTWASLATSMFPNDTVSAQVVQILLWAGSVTGRFGPAMRQMQAAYQAGHISTILPLLPVRSPAHVVDKINANGPAVLIANAWEDALFPPGQVVDFYNTLTCAKRLMLAPGDHATAELPGLLGLPNNPWIAVRQWMDDHLRGIGAVDPDRAVALKSAGGGGWHFYSDWPTASPDRTRRYLSEPISEHPLFPRTGFLQADAAPSWGYPIEAGIPTAAESGDALITGALEGYFNVPPTVLIPLIRRSAAGVWSTHRLSASALLSGSAHVHLTIASSAATGSLFVYLYDVDEVDLGRLITHVPYTLAHAAPDAPRTVDVHLEPISWRVHGGHCLALVIDTMDRRYRSASVVGSTIRISSPAGDPSYTDLPIAL